MHINDSGTVLTRIKTLRARCATLLHRGDAANGFHIVDARVLQDSLLIYVERQTTFDEFARRMIAALACRLHALEDISVRNGTQRLIGYLLSTDEAQRGSPSAQVGLATAKGIMASRLNVTQEHLSKILHELSASGLIEVDGWTVRIPDIERLRIHME